MTREFLEYLPPRHLSASPLVIVLHGSLMDSKSMREWAGYEFEQLADQHGFVVVYPDGYRHNWNDCHSKAVFPVHTENIEEMGFVKGLIAREVAQCQDVAGSLNLRRDDRIGMSEVLRSTLSSATRCPHVASDLESEVIIQVR